MEIGLATMMQATYVEVHQQRQSSDTWWSRKDWLPILSLTLQALSIIMRSSPLVFFFFPVSKSLWVVAAGATL